MRFVPNSQCPELAHFDVRNCDALTAPRLRATLKSGVVCSTSAAGKPVFVPASVGVALYPDDGTTASELLTSADKSMYAQKRGLSVA